MRYLVILPLVIVILGFLIVPWLGPKHTEPAATSVPKAKLGQFISVSTGSGTGTGTGTATGTDGYLYLYLWGSGKPSPQPRVSKTIICDHQNHDADHHHYKTHDLSNEKIKAIPEGGIGGHSSGRVPFKTSPDEVREQWVFAP